jgi:predicted 3-demethylubiquinone-9 3-methyltransferase (glyoxalase superfamily)
MPKINPFLWFDTQAEEAAKFYVSVFPNSKIETVVRTTDAGPGPKGTVLTVAFKLDGKDFVALNGGPNFKFTEAVSFVIDCKNQEEVDHYWSKLLEGGGKESQCGWLWDRYGLSWQVTPTVLLEMINDPDPKKAARVMAAMMKMVKIDIPTLKRAYEG